VHGYSDRIHHALAYAAKHHDHQVRKGVRAPYLTQPANIGIILTRYGQDETTVVAGILHDVVEDCFREGQSPETIQERLGEKFGEDVLEILTAIAQRRTDDDGVEMSAEEQRNDLVNRLESASDRGRWVCVADKLHDACSLIADLRRTMDPGTVWSRTPAGQAGTVRWYRAICARLELLGFAAPILDEMRGVVAQLESFVAR
jgi:(p)ppGpp synthase/HD superfamily hydrolase